MGLLPERKSSQLGLFPPDGSAPAEEAPDGFETAKSVSMWNLDACMYDAAQGGVTANKASGRCYLTRRR